MTFSHCLLEGFYECASYDLVLVGAVSIRTEADTEAAKARQVRGIASFMAMHISLGGLSGILDSFLLCGGQVRAVWSEGGVSTTQVLRT